MQSWRRVRAWLSNVPFRSGGVRYLLLDRRREVLENLRHRLGDVLVAGKNRRLVVVEAGFLREQAGRCESERGNERDGRFHLRSPSLFGGRIDGRRPWLRSVSARARRRGVELELDVGGH